MDGKGIPSLKKQGKAKGNEKLHQKMGKTQKGWNQTKVKAVKKR